MPRIILVPLYVQQQAERMETAAAFAGLQLDDAAQLDNALLMITGHYVPLLSLAVAQYSRANAGSGFNLQGMAVGERAAGLT